MLHNIEYLIHLIDIFRKDFNRNFKTTSVDQKWTTDGIRALSPIIDIYEKEIVDYGISTNPNLFQTYCMLDIAFNSFKDT